MDFDSEINRPEDCPGSLENSEVCRKCFRKTDCVDEAQVKMAAFMNKSIDALEKKGEYDQVKLPPSPQDLQEMNDHINETMVEIPYGHVGAPVRHRKPIFRINNKEVAQKFIDFYQWFSKSFKAIGIKDDKVILDLFKGYSGSLFHDFADIWRKESFKKRAKKKGRKDDRTGNSTT